MINDTWKRRDGLVICLLGPMEIWRDGQDITESYPETARKVLAFLVLADGAPVQRSKIANDIWWDEADQAGASPRDKLRQHLRKLRTALGADSARLKEPKVVVGEALQFDLTDVVVDIALFRAARLATTADPRRRRLEEAVRYYRGPLLADFDAPWTKTPRGLLRHGYVETIRLLSNQALQDGAGKRAEEWLRGAIALDPSNEELAILLMDLLAREGRTRDVEETYANLERALIDDDQADSFEPSARTQSLFKKHMSRLAEYDRGEAVAAVPKPVSQAENLPAVNHPLIGQESLCDSIALLMHTSRLVTLTGPSGIGKTRIALEMARRLAGDFADGAVFVDLTSFARSADSGAITQHFARALNVSEEWDRNPRQSLNGLLAKRRQLIVVDNCEHVVEAASTVIKDLLGSSGAVKVLATSHEALRTDEPKDFATELEAKRSSPRTLQAVQRIPPLAIPAVAEAWTPDAVGRSEAGRLFLDRVSKFDFSVTSEAATEIGWICRTLEGIPLAIEIAATALSDFGGTTALVASMRASLPSLEGSGSELRHRYRSLDAMIDWSYSLMSAEDQVFLQNLSVIRGNASLASIQSICDCSDAIVKLRDLEARSLVVSESPPGLATDPSSLRFRLLEPIRQFAADRLAETGRSEEAQRRHALCFVDLLESMAPELQGRGQTRVLNTLDAERANFDAALRWCLRDEAAAEDVTIGLRIVGRIWRLWMIRGGQTTGKEMMDRFYCRRHLGPAEVRLRFIHGAGTLALLRKDTETAEPCFRETLTLAREIGDEVSEAGALASLATVARQSKNLPAASELLLQSRDIFGRLQNRESLASVLGNLANVATERKDYLEAAKFHQEAIDILRKLSAPHNLILALNNLAHTYLQMGELPSVAHVLEEVFRRSDQTENMRGRVHGLSLAITLLQEKRLLVESALLMGIHDSLRKRYQLPLPPDTLAEYVALQSTTRAALGDNDFDRQFNAGQDADEASANGRVYVCLARCAE